MTRKEKVERRKDRKKEGIKKIRIEDTAKQPDTKLVTVSVIGGWGGGGGGAFGPCPLPPGAMLAPLSGKIMGYYLAIEHFQSFNLLQRPHLRLPLNTIVPALYAYVNNYLMS